MVKMSTMNALLYHYSAHLTRDLPVLLIMQDDQQPAEPFPTLLPGFKKVPQATL